MPLRELIVVDSGSSDGSPVRIRRAFPTVHLIELGSTWDRQSRATGGGDPVVGVHFVGTMVLAHARAKPGRAIRTLLAQCVSTSCVLADRAILLKPAAWTILFIYLEDMEFGLQLRSLGRRLTMEPTALAWRDRGACSAAGC